MGKLPACFGTSKGSTPCVQPLRDDLVMLAAQANCRQASHQTHGPPAPETIKHDPPPVSMQTVLPARLTLHLADVLMGLITLDLADVALAPQRLPVPHSLEGHQPLLHHPPHLLRVRVLSSVLRYCLP